MKTTCLTTANNVNLHGDLRFLCILCGAPGVDRHSGTFRRGIISTEERTETTSQTKYEVENMMLNRQLIRKRMGKQLWEQ